MRLFALMVCALVFQGSVARTAETMIGPITHVCRDVTADKEGLSLTLMWVTGYVSGINNLQKPDMLQGLNWLILLGNLLKLCNRRIMRT